jgi:hypothetical protein
MKRPPFERVPRVPEFDPGRPRMPLDDNGVDLVYAPKNDPAALDRIAELLDRLFSETTSTRGRQG